MLNQPWREWDPSGGIHHIHRFINFTTLMLLPDCFTHIRSGASESCPPPRSGVARSAPVGLCSMTANAPPRPNGRRVAPARPEGTGPVKDVLRLQAGECAGAWRTSIVYCSAAVRGGSAFFKSHGGTDKIIDFSEEPAALVRDDGYAVLGCGRDV